jgi:alpha-glucosidase
MIMLEEDGDTESMLQEDNGLSHAFASGAFLRKTFPVSRRGQRLSVTSKSSGNGFPEFRRQRLRFRLRGFSGDRIELEGSAIDPPDARFACENRGQDFSFSFSV